MNVVTVDPRLDFGGDPEVVSSRNFMNEVVMHEPNYLFDYSNLGHQGYLTDPDTLELLERLAIRSHPPRKHASSHAVGGTHGAQRRPRHH